MRNYIRFYNTVGEWQSSGGNFSTNFVAQSLDDIDQAVDYNATFFHVDRTIFQPSFGEFRKVYLLLDHELLWRMLVYNNGFWEDGQTVPFGKYPWIRYDSPREDWSGGE